MVRTDVPNMIIATATVKKETMFDRRHANPYKELDTARVYHGAITGNRL